MIAQVVKTVVTGIIPQLLQSLLMIPVGIVMFLFSFLILWMNEGLPLRHELAEQTAVMSPDGSGAPRNGAAVSVTGPMTASAPVTGDDGFFVGGEYVAVYRVAEAFAWHETVTHDSERRWGGSIVDRQTYDYALQWAEFVPDHSRFEEPDGHLNVPMTVGGAFVSGASFRVGSVPISAEKVVPPGATMLDWSHVTRVGRGESGTLAGRWLYLAGADPANPQPGDQRVMYWVVRQGQPVTVFGAWVKGALQPLDVDGMPFFDIISGPREAAIEVLEDEDNMRIWALRVFGVLVMWGGLFLIFSPVYSVCDIIPPLGILMRVLVALGTIFPTILLSGVTVALSIVGHNGLWTGMILGSMVAFILLQYYVWPRWRPRRASADTATPMPADSVRPVGEPTGNGDEQSAG